jgi:hypothetical protein
MATDAERFRILADLKLSTTWYDDKVVVFWRGTAPPGQSAGYRAIAEGKTLEEATDEAIRLHAEKQARRTTRG